MTTEDTSHLLVEHVLDDASSYDDDIDQMEQVLTDQSMEKINIDLGKMQSVENIKDDSFMK